MQLAIEKVFSGVEHAVVRGSIDSVLVGDVVYASSEVKPGALFFCVVGTRVDGHDFAQAAVAAGAVALVVERPVEGCEVPQIQVADTRRALALCAANFFGRPAEKLSLVGVTGTNGKTTTTFLVEHMAACAAKVKTGLVGTVEVHVGDERRRSLRTTPESRDLQALLADMVDAGVGVAALEVSSHAIDLNRIAGTRFAVAAFTNLSQDHLDYHKTMEDYFAAKARLFTDHEVGARVVCIDHEHGRRLVQICEQAGHEVLTVGANREAFVHLERAVYAPHTTLVTLSFGGQQTDEFALPLVGRFNVENALVCAGIGVALGYAPQEICDALASAPQVPGRMQSVQGTDGTQPPFGVLVDYAHTPDAVAKAISAVADVTPGRVICVFGCGGDRDRDKRPKMGAAALSADIAVVTSDNPRTEDARSIIDQILPGMEGAGARVHVEPDRRRAVRLALSLAESGDAVLICGKGHEDYQIVGTEKLPFDDRVVAAEEIDAL